MGAAEGCHSWTGCVSRVLLQRDDLSMMVMVGLGRKVGSLPLSKSWERHE